MAEFCVDCWNEILGTNYKQSKFIIYYELRLCEGCNKYKRCVIVEKKVLFVNVFKYLFFPLYIVFKMFYYVLRLLMLPYLFVKDRLDKKYGNIHQRNT